MKTTSGIEWYTYPRDAKKTRWILRYALPGEKTRYRSFRQKGDAEARLIAIDKEYMARPGIKGEDMPVPIYVESWKTDNLGTVAVSSRASYESRLGRIVDGLGHYTVQQLKRETIKAFFLGLLRPKPGASGAGTLAAASVAGIRALLFSMLDEAVRKGIIPENPANLGRKDRVRLRQTTEERVANIKAMEPEELARFLTVDPEEARVPPSHALLFEVMASTGMRIGEAQALTWEALNRRKRTLKLIQHIAQGAKGKPYVAPGTKTGGIRSVALPAELFAKLEHFETGRKEAALKAGAPRPEWIFANDRGIFFRYKALHESFRRLVKSAGLAGHFTSHCLRHTYATIQLDAGVPIQTVQKVLGHKSIKETVDTYGSWVKDPNVEGLADAFRAIITKAAATKRA
jgi:integrase